MSIANWIALFVDDNNWSASYEATYFESFGVEHILKETKRFIGNKNIYNQKCEHTIQ